MKYLISFLLLIISVGVIAQNPDGHVYSRYVAKYHFFNLHDGDTMNIDKDDLVVRASLYVPDNATDSVYVSGDTITIDGFQTTPHSIGPGEWCNIGDEDVVRINKLRIQVEATKLKLILIRAKK